jgi:5'-nucleotidase
LRLLISNDDGVHSEGIIVLANELKKSANVVVVAPDRERSAAAHSLTLHHPLRVERIRDSFYAVDGTPTDSVILGVNEVLKKKPDIVVAGINKGANLGDDITYSGTVAAAIEGTLLGVPSFAISIASVNNNFFFESAAFFASKIVKSIMRYGLPKDTLLNVNVPSLPIEEIKGIMITRQGKRVYDNTIVKKKDPRGKDYYWMGGDDIGFKKEPDTDFDAIEKKYVSVTPIKLDYTNHDAIRSLKDWEI